jgi:HTH-type transcriptional regulator/antitoxin HigA
MVGKNTYKPDFVVPPGEILEETLKARNLGKGEFAQRTGLSMKTISLILAGKAPILPDTALQFEQVLGVSAELWTGLETRYRLALARREALRADEELASWAKRFPNRELVKRGVIPKNAKGVELGRCILSFFGVANQAAWQSIYGGILAGTTGSKNALSAAASFRRSAFVAPSPEKLATWLRLAELAAQEVDTAPFDKRNFERAIRQARELTVDAPEQFHPRLFKLCAQSGVAFVLVPAIPGCGTYGATRWLSKGKAILVLSNLRKSDDHFWFSFFHEAGHILLHSKDETFIEGCESIQEVKEAEADRFAREILIPKDIWDEFVQASRFYEDDILSFSRRAGIAPGIVVGFLQHDGLIKKEWHNRLKRKFEIMVK